MEHIISWLSTLLEVVGSGVGVWAITEGVKRVNALPINPGQTGRIRAVAGSLSVASTLLLGLVNHNLTPDDASGALAALIAAGIAFLSAHTTHQIVKK